MKPLSVIAFMDGRAGHEKQTRGILTALAGMTPIHVAVRTVAPGFFLQRLQRWLRYIACAPIPLKKQADPTGIDLIIGAGACTHIPMLELKRRSGAKAVTSMSPGFPLMRRMDLCLIPEHDGKSAGENIFVTIGPPNTSTAKGQHRSDLGLILIGGIDPKSHRWSTVGLLSQIRMLLDADDGVSWTVSSSPRTPESTCAALERLAAANSRVRFFRSDATPSGWVEAQYDDSDRVWVTADSVSMVFEALTAGCRVGILPVDWKRGRNKIKRSADLLIDR